MAAQYELNVRVVEARNLRKVIVSDGPGGPKNGREGPALHPDLKGNFALGGGLRPRQPPALALPGCW